MFQTEVYIERRKILCEKIGSGLILFWGNDESPKNFTDNNYHFRQHSSFLYYFGIDCPSLAAIMDIDKAPKVFAARLGFLMTTVIAVLFILELQLASFVVAGMLIFFAGLEFGFAICVGCTIYTYLILPFYKK